VNHALVVQRKDNSLRNYERWFDSNRGRLCYGVGLTMDDELRGKLQELRYFMENATAGDEVPIAALDAWFDAYKERATVQQHQELRDAMQRLAPVAAQVLVEIIGQSSDPEVVTASQLMLERIGPIRSGGTN
jgi:hypothetical protein